MTTARSVYTLPLLAERAGIEYRTAHKWMERGILTPSIREADGSGHAAVFSHDDLQRAVLLAKLRDVGLSMDGLAQVVKDPRPIGRLMTEWAVLTKCGVL